MPFGATAQEGDRLLEEGGLGVCGHLGADRSCRDPLPRPSLLRIGLAVVALAGCVRPAASQATPCDPFFIALASIPDLSTERRTGALASLLDGAPLTGCEVVGEADANDPGLGLVPDFRPERLRRK